MKVQSLRRQMRLREWAEQVKECEQSGLPVGKWCEETGIPKKTYYNRRNRVREELLDIVETSGALRLSGLGSDGMGKLAPKQPEPPIFAALPMPQDKGPAVTVWIGRYAVDIQNGANETVVGQVLKVVSLL